MVEPKQEESLEFDLADEQQILDELQGKALASEDRWVYPIQGGFQLSYKAVKMACRLFAEHGEAIEVDFPADVRYDPTNPEYILVQVKATRVKIDKKAGTRIVLDSEIGAKRKWVKEKLKDNSIRPDQFYFEKAVAQAQRNAKMALLPQDFVKNFLAQLLKQGKVPASPAKPAQAKPQAAPPPKEGPPKTQEFPKTQEPPKQNGKGSELSALHQQFWAVLKAVTQKKDEAAGRQALKRLAGKEKVSELTEAELKKLGGLLRKVTKGECSIMPSEWDPKSKSIIVDGPTKEVVWPEGYKAPAKEEPPAQEEAPPTQDAPPAGNEWMF